jgi:hypothetical protein
MLEKLKKVYGGGLASDDHLFKIELLFIDKLNNSAKIKVTNLKTGEISQQPVDSFEASYGEE